MAEEIKVFATDRLSFLQRFLHILQLISIGIVVSVFILVFSTDKNTHILFTIAIVYFIAVLLVSIYRSINYIYEVQIEANKIRFIGERYNQKWVEVIEIQNLDIFIEEEHTRSRRNYFLVFESNDNRKFIVNRKFNWSYFMLYKLYKEFKKAKSERIIWDEKFLLDGIEKNAKKEFEWRD